MKIKVSKATNLQLNWMVAKCIYPYGSDEWLNCISAQEHYCTDWAQGGPIIEREGIELKRGFTKPLLWSAFCTYQWNGRRLTYSGMTGPTPLIAAMRCFVALQLGKEVDVPEELK